MNNYAVVDENGLVDNIIAWDGTTSFNPGDEFVMVQIEDGIICHLGYTYDGTNFNPPIITTDDTTDTSDDSTDTVSST